MEHAVGVFDLTGFSIPTGNTGAFGSLTGGSTPSVTGWSNPSSSTNWGNFSATPNWTFDTSGIGGVNAASVAAPAAAASTQAGASLSTVQAGNGVGNVSQQLNQNLGNSTPLGWNVGTGQLAISGLSTLGQLWTAWNSVDLAKKNYNLTKATSQANLNNQVSSYNTNLEDKINSRYFTEGKTQAAADAYYNSHKLEKVNL